MKSPLGLGRRLQPSALAFDRRELEPEHCQSIATRVRTATSATTLRGVDSSAIYSRERYRPGFFRRYEGAAPTFVSVSHLVVTGASTGIGRATVVDLAGEFARITLVGRSADRHGPVLDDLRSLGRDPCHIECDLGSLRSVSQAAEAVEGSVEVLIANAGVAGQRGITEDGFELHFGVNHLAHHLLVTELATRITDRVLTVSSNAHFDASDLDLDRVKGATRTFTGFEEYRVSKLANVWFGRQLASRYAFASYIVHPGVVATDIWRRIPWPIRPLLTRRMSTPEEGAATSVWASRAQGLESGGYFARSAPRSPSEVALDDDKAHRLWERSQEWVEPFRRTSEGRSPNT